MMPGENMGSGGRSFLKGMEAFQDQIMCIYVCVCVFIYAYTNSTCMYYQYVLMRIVYAVLRTGVWRKTV